ncbi:MAG: SDR family oxidoreductase [Oscillospiraceae bacterium]|jgi:3-oxoacyl-[acyl-carrier protein] reductase|nr:SDR family oxidoreductase [Oscillospiraceae bacterium]
MAQYKEYGLDGRTAIVTGAGTGIGKGCALELAKSGVKVALFGRRTGPIEEVAAECAKYTPGAFALSVDVSDKAAVDAAVAKVFNEFGRIDILINNAGVEHDYQAGEVPFEAYFDMEPDEYLRFFKIHALGHYLMMQAAVQYMKEAKYGRIVNITSVTGVTGGYSSAAYTSSKAAAILQTKSFASKYGKYNIIVNSIAPGMVNTPMKRNSTPEEFEMVAKMSTFGRVSEPVDIARVALFLAQENVFLTGQNIVTG